MEMEKKPKVGQYLSVTFSQRGGGERVQHSLYKLFKAYVFTLKKSIKGREYKKVGTEEDQRLMSVLSKV